MESVAVMKTAPAQFALQLAQNPLCRVLYCLLSSGWPATKAYILYKQTICVTADSRSLLDQHSRSQKADQVAAGRNLGTPAMGYVELPDLAPAAGGKLHGEIVLDGPELRATVDLLKEALAELTQGMANGFSSHAPAPSGPSPAPTAAAAAPRPATTAHQQQV